MESKSFRADIPKLRQLGKDVINGTDDQFATSLEDNRYERFLLLSRPFLFRVHGSLEQKKSWILGARQRNRLLKNHTYRSFIKSLLSTRRLVIVGLRPDDIALQTLLIDDFRTDITRGVSHFWICPNPTEDAKRWAEVFNVSIIGYSPSEETHSDVNNILDKLATFQPREPDTLAAYAGQSIDVDELPPDSELRVSTVEDIRHRLNAAIKGLDRSGSIPFGITSASSPRPNTRGIGRALGSGTVTNSLCACAHFVHLPQGS